MVALVCVLVFVIFFSVGAGPLPFLYMSEILSSSIKGKVTVQPCSLPARSGHVCSLDVLPPLHAC